MRPLKILVQKYFRRTKRMLEENWGSGAEPLMFMRRTTLKKEKGFLAVVWELATMRP